MEIAVVKYGNFNASNDQIRDWSKSLHCDEFIIVNNHEASLADDEIKGDNSLYDFSGYSIAIKAFKTDGPFVLVNDTLLKHHIPIFWRSIIRSMQHAKLDTPTVWGDHRKESTSFPEKEKIFLASWIFYIPDRPSLLLIQQTLEIAIQQLNEPVSVEYQQYIDQWLLQPTPFRGWVGNMNNEAYARKNQAIRIEHRWSRELSKAGALRSFQQVYPLYGMIRLMERLKYRFDVLLKK
jgi:hypothetical protein